MNKEELEGLLGINCCEYHEEIGKKAKKEIKRLHSIIKEVREFIKDNAMYSEEEKICCDDLYSSDCDKVLKILYKIEEKEND